MNEFVHKHGENVTERMVPTLMEALAGLINKSEINHNGRSCKLKVLGSVKQDEDDEWSLMFDVLDPDDTFDHVEFNITKTGWGRSFTQTEEPTNDQQK
jgi:hypothetical protein